MKKKITILLILLFTFASLFGGVHDNLQKIYSVDSDEYEAISYLYISAGKALPSTTGPWSGAELKMMLDDIDADLLSGYALELYNNIYATVSAPDARFNPNDLFSFTISGDAGLSATYHTNPEDFNSPDDVANSGTTDYKTTLPLISVPLETWIGDNIYGYSSFDLGINRTLINTKIEKDSTETAGVGFRTNVLLLPPSVLNDLNLNFPYRAFGSIGGDWYSFEIGRDNISWGAGESGNLTLGDQLPYHNQVRFTAFTPSFKYTFLTSFFPHPSNYVYTENVDDVDYDEKDKPVTKVDKDWIDNHYEMRDSKDGISAFISHRLEWRIKDKIGMALTESIMYQNENNLDLTVLSPTAVFHNFYIRKNANSLLSFEIDYTPIENINIYGQVAIDEFRLPGEFSTDGPPSAFGFILGAKGAMPLKSGILYGAVEGAYTDPYLYIRDDGGSYDPYKYGIPFIGAIPEFVSAEDLGNYTLLPLGYRYGNDAIVAYAKVGYKEFSKWYSEASFRYLLDGCFDINTRWNNDVIPGTDNDPQAPSEAHPDEGSYDPNSNWKDRNAVGKNIAITLKGGITLLDNLDIEAEATYITINNFRNIEGEKTNDFQLEISARYSF